MASTSWSGRNASVNKRELIFHGPARCSQKSSRRTNVHGVMQAVKGGVGILASQTEDNDFIAVPMEAAGHLIAMGNFCGRSSNGVVMSRDAHVAHWRRQLERHGGGGINGRRQA